MITIRLVDIVDNIMALSALRGDITGRGSMLVDNDDNALQQLLRTLIPAELSALRLAHVGNDEVWTVDTDAYSSAQLTAYLSDLLHCKISGSPDRPLPPEAFGADDPCPIVPCFA